jgi:hypothetical protein
MITHTACCILSLPLLLHQNNNSNDNISSITNEDNDRSIGSDDDDENTGKTEVLPFNDLKVTRRRRHHHRSHRDSLDSAYEEMLRRQNDDQDDLTVSDPFVSIQLRY